MGHQGRVIKNLFYTPQSVLYPATHVASDGKSGPGNFSCKVQLNWNSGVCSRVWVKVAIATLIWQLFFQQKQDREYPDAVKRLSYFDLGGSFGQNSTKNCSSPLLFWCGAAEEWQLWDLHYCQVPEGIWLPYRRWQNNFQDFARPSLWLPGKYNNRWFLI